jgi:hypothetical protein
MYALITDVCPFRAVWFSGTRQLSDVADLRQSIDLILCNPAVPDDTWWTEWRVILRSAAIPTVFLVSPEPDSVRAAIRESHLPDQIVVIRGPEELGALHAAVTRLGRRSVMIDFLSLVRDPLLYLSWRTQFAVLAALFTSAQSPKAVAKYVGLSRRSLDRSLRKAGLQPVSWFCRAATVLRVAEAARQEEDIGKILIRAGVTCRRTVRKTVTSVVDQSLSDFIAVARSGSQRIVTIVAERTIASASAD